EVRDYVRGLYGAPPGPIDADLRRKVLADAAPIQGRPADLLAPEFDRALEEVRALVPAADDAEAISYAVFPAVYKAYRASRDRGLTDEALTSAALGIVGALRARPASLPAPPSPLAREEAGGMSAWAHEGRNRLHSQRRWIDASTRRTLR
ncbi:Conserved carboxylase region domain protein, partial [mine drainage metagenome]